MKIIFQKNQNEDLEGNSYYLGRYLCERNSFKDIDNLFEVDSETRSGKLDSQLKKYFEEYRLPHRDGIRYATFFNKYIIPRPLSLAAGMGHIPSILHI
jgi:hypothetical protein